MQKSARQPIDHNHRTRRHDTDWAVLRRVLREAAPYRALIFAIFFLSLLATPIALLTPIPLKVVVDNVLGPDTLPGIFGSWFPRGNAGYGLGLLIAVAILQVLIAFFSQLQGQAHSLLYTLVGEKLSLGFRAKLLNQAQRLSFSFHDKRGTHDSIFRIQYDTDSIKYLAVHTIIAFASNMFALVGMTIVMLNINVELALIALAVIPLMVLYTRFYKKRMVPRYSEAKQLESSALGVVQEVLTSFRVVKAFGREAHEEARFVERSSEGMRARLRLAFAEAGFSMLVGMTTAVATAFVLYVGVRNVHAGHLSVGELLMVLAYLGQLYNPVRSLTNELGALPKMLVSARRAFDLLDERPEVIERADAQPIERTSGRIEFRDVAFEYETGQPILDGISFATQPGTSLGIRGRTGAGKSTLVNLLTRFYDPTTGAVFLDGVDLRDYRISDLRRQFSIVLQDPVLFAATIAENIAYARPEASMEEIVAAAQAADAHEFILGLPEGYDTVVGERGMRLSGGERQRISIARAFLKDAPILILDEPTSSVDVQTEAAIMQTMAKLMAGRTTLMIAHRLSTLENCDDVLVVESGRGSLQSQLIRSRDEVRGISRPRTA